MTESSGACEGIGNETTMKTGNSDGQFRGNSSQFLSARFLILAGARNTKRSISDKQRERERERRIALRVCCGIDKKKRRKENRETTGGEIGARGEP